MSFRSSASSSSSSSSQDTMRHVSSNLPSHSQVLATAIARVYHRPFNARSENWTYHGLRGTMVFGRSLSVLSTERKSGSIDCLEETLWFRLIDPMKGLVWLHQVPNAFDYSLDKPFFHQFSGKSRMFGFVFDDDSEAATFLKQVTSNVNIKASASRKKAPGHTPRRLSPSMVSSPAPGTFVHVAHVGFDSDGRVETSHNISSDWKTLVEKLKGYGVSSQIAENDRDFVPGLVTGAKTASGSPASESAAIPTQDTREKHVWRNSTI